MYNTNGQQQSIERAEEILYTRTIIRRDEFNLLRSVRDEDERFGHLDEYTKSDLKKKFRREVK